MLADKHIFDLIDELPCLRDLPRDKRPAVFDPDEFHDRHVKRAASDVEIQSALFILTVWNAFQARTKGWVFDFAKFARIADAEHRQAVCDWLTDPWWP